VVLIMDIESLMELLYRIGADEETRVFVEDEGGNFLKIDDVRYEDGGFGEIIVIKTKKFN